MYFGYNEICSCLAQKFFVKSYGLNWPFSPFNQFKRLWGYLRSRYSTDEVQHLSYHQVDMLFSDVFLFHILLYNLEDWNCDFNPKLPPVPIRCYSNLHILCSWSLLAYAYPFYQTFETLKAICYYTVYNPQQWFFFDPPFSLN